MIFDRLNNRRNVIIYSLLSFISLIVFIYSRKFYTLSSDSTIFNVITFTFWLLLILNYISIFLLSKYIKNIYFLVLFIIFYNLLLYSSNFFFIIPFQQTDIGSITKYLTIMKISTSIGPYQINIDPYFEWPIYFIFSRIIMLIFNTSIDVTINVGYYLFILLLPLFTTLLFLSQKISIKNMLYISPIYILLSYEFIVLQFAPQTLAYLYTVIIFALYIKNRNYKITPLLFILYISLVFVHPFFFIVFLSSIALDILFLNRNQYYNNKKLILTLVGIYLTSYLFIFHSITSNIQSLLNSFGLLRSGMWTLLGNILGIGPQLSPNPYIPHYLYNLFSAQSQLILSNTSRIILITLAFLFILNFLILFKEKKLSTIIQTYDIGIIVSTFFIGFIGLISSFLGERSIQASTLSISKVYEALLHKSKIYKVFLLLIIIISPIIFQCTSLGDEIITGSRAIKDFELEQSGQFIDIYGMNYQHVLAANSGYPTGYYTNSTMYYVNPNEFIYISINNNTSNMDLIIYSPKMRMQAEYYGINGLNEGILNDNNILFNNNYTMVINTRNVLK